MGSQKLIAVWRIITSNSATAMTQKHPGCVVDTVSYGRGGLQDMYLMATEIKQIYNGLLKTIEAAAIEGGELHALKEMREAVETLEKM